jgi:hypothetical protein
MTATAVANGIATQSAVNGAQATATASTSQNLYTVSTGGNPVLNDPLSDDSRGYGWSTASSSGGGKCQFTGGAYHVSVPNNSFFQTCYASATSFANFAFSVQMRIVQGNCGGMLFRVAAEDSKFYYWRMCQDGSYGLFIYVTNSGNTTKTLLNSTTGLFNTGLNQSNLLTVIVKGQTIYLYVNKQKVDSVNDGTYGRGEIGLSAETFSSSPTEVAYSNAEVWQL